MMKTRMTVVWALTRTCKLYVVVPKNLTSLHSSLDNPELGYLEAVDGADDIFRGADGALAGRIADMVGGVGTIGGPTHTHNIIVTGGLPSPVLPTKEVSDSLDSTGQTILIVFQMIWKSSVGNVVTRLRQRL